VHLFYEDCITPDEKSRSIWSGKNVFYMQKTAVCRTKY